MTIEKVINYVSDIKPHAFQNETLVMWLNECEGHIQTEVLSVAIENIVSYEYEADRDKELIINAPHDKLYGLYLTAMIDFMHGEYSKYENTMQMYNAALEEYSKWFIRHHTRNCGTYEENIRGYYISAYGLAQKHGFSGTEEEWLKSLKGDKGDQGNGLEVKGVVASVDELEAVEAVRYDVYVADGMYYVFNGASWDLIGAVRGEKGEKGEQGIQGQQGIQGEKGEKGDKGEQGIQGEKGDKGDKGEKGEAPVIKKDENGSVIVNGEKIVVYDDEEVRKNSAARHTHDNKDVLNSISIVDGKVLVKDDDVTIELVPAYQTYGVSIDLSNSNPETAVTYIGDAVGMVAGSSDWYEMSIFKNIKPCLFKDGAVVDYLNKDNFAQFEDGSAADITSGDAGDVMIEIHKTGYKITKANNVLTVQVTDDPNKKGFCYKAHTRTNAGDRDKLYIGAFLGSSQANKLRSISGVSPQNNTTLTNFREQAKRNGEGYDLLAFYPMTLLQCLYLIIYKNLNSQAAIGMGYVGDYNGEYNQKNTGATIDKGMNYGTSSEMEQMKFLGIEDFWGNLYQWIDGLVTSIDGNALVATDNFNDTGNGYTDVGFITNDGGGYLKVPQGTNDLGFVISKSGGSTTTYFTDNVKYLPYSGGCVPYFGGCFYEGSFAGAFRVDVFYHPNYQSVEVGARLMFL